MDNLPSHRASRSVALGGRPAATAGRTPVAERGGAPAARPVARPHAGGKFIFRGDRKLYVRGVTYGTFRPDYRGEEFYDRERVERDFSMMAEHGVNAVRVYTVPPRWLLDAAERQGLSVMVGLPWEQHVAFLDDRARARSIVERVRAGVAACAGHPAILCFCVGNEIPAAIVRWHGRRRVERFIERLYRAAKAEDPAALVTYVSFPSTEYLELPFLDLACFNVYLESRERLEAYLARLQNLAGDRPLLMAEIGLDSRRHGVDEQAQSLAQQVQASFAAGCAGTFVFSWTDEWHRGGHDVEDWDFGLTDRRRSPKPALGTVRAAYEQAPIPRDVHLPRISVVVCSHDGNGTLSGCMEGLHRLRYPDYEVIVVDDGSPDPSAALRAHEYGFRLIQTDNRGLSSARNTGWQTATGEIVAYIDDDAWPDPDWLTFLAASFASGEYAAVGGPNIAPPGDGPVAACVANSPGGPIHVLLSDTEAEHLPGCNMAFRRDALEAVGGFDPQFRAAGDDVDLCWRLRERGLRLGFSPAAMVWHHRRNSVRAYWRQQRGYGRAEAQLERKWPERYNEAGHLRWAGRLYGAGLTRPPAPRRWHVYHGVWGTGAFQRLYAPGPGRWGSATLMPEWLLVVAALAALTALGALWTPLLLAAPLAAAALGATVLQAGLSAAEARYSSPATTPARRFARWTLTSALHVLQPLARLRGRLGDGLTPWRRHRRTHRPSLPRPRTATAWYDRWRDPAQCIATVEAALRRRGAAVIRGGDFDRFELELRGGLLASARMRCAVEEHGAGRQLARFRTWPRVGSAAAALVTAPALLAVAAALDGAAAAAGALGGLAVAAGWLVLREASYATAALRAAIGAASGPEPPPRPVHRP